CWGRRDELRRCCRAAACSCSRPRPSAALVCASAKAHKPPPRVGALRRRTCASQGQGPCDQPAGAFFLSHPNIHIVPRRNQMSTAQETSNKATFRRMEDAVSTGDAEVISKVTDELVAPDVVIHMPLPMEATGPQAFKQVWAMLLRGLPDLRLTIEDLIAEGDKVVARNTVNGTHLGEYRGLPPTGKTVTYDEIFIFRFAGGRIAEMWGVVDVFSQLKQLGVIPAQRT